MLHSTLSLGVYLLITTISCNILINKQEGNQITNRRILTTSGDEFLE